ncbi:MAG: transcription-repair coupling factor [Lachnospiraceae bacterium]|nr:transcription-repair coupling factor [Ruminococcus sp.]MCM1275733.1 transcription-repair coupling factor [Lachnospiraceae bacterium]
MNFFIDAARQNPDFARLASYLGNEKNKLPALVTGVSHIHKAHFIAALGDSGVPTVVVAESEGEAQKLCTDINAMLGETAALLYPEKDFSFADAEAASREYEHKRIFALNALLNKRCKAVICSAGAAAQLTIPPEELRKRTVTLSSEDEISLGELVSRLVSAGYSRADMTEGAGQFSVRGGIVDVFPPSSAAPYRIELWGDSIDSLYEFDIDSQRRTESLRRISISPARETLFDSAEALCSRIEELAKKLRGKKAEAVRERLSEDVKKLRNGVELRGTDRFFPLCYENEATVFDYAERVFVCENAAVRESFRGAALQHAEDLKILVDEGRICKGLDRFMLTKAELYSALESRARVYFDSFVRGGGLELGTIINVHSAIQTGTWSGEYKILEDELKSFLGRGMCCFIFAGTEKGAKNLAADLASDGFNAEYYEKPESVIAGKAVVAQGTLSAGAEYPEAGLAVFTHTAVHAARRRVPKKKRGEEIRSLEDIAVGDLVVHASYGIGVFDGVRKIDAGGVSKDYIRIKYAGADSLNVPVTQLDMISRYIGTGDASTVKLNKLNSEQWSRSKAKAKAAAKEMAAELIALYAKRMSSRGFAFPEDDTLQEDFEQHFAYVETDSQLRCIDEIKADMQRPQPMERLLCGDVGFGKTEVALRAAFKCVESGKQCALLAPTTVLAWQHYQTASGRMEGFPINIALLSRYKSAAEQKEILKGLASGRIDMVIGTHRIIQNDVKFKDLGLVIIDEEQRFGVAHKDKFKTAFSGVDILSLSATPIPRTLNMAMSGIRDMSVLDEPPQDRQPVASYVIEHDWGVVAQAVQKELRRSGQVYYVHNRVESIYGCADKLRQLVPEAEIGVAHGKMSEDELLEVWRRLLDGELDVLVCTTIIETGVDVPNVNTLIIENADYMGLAQLHQLRGRVGRTNKRAYAYFTFKPGKVLTEISQRRLDAIREFTQFGSGFRIALRDLEIRGAGNILGSSQSGHLANVGYDMYLQLLDEAVREEKGEKNVRKEDCLVDVRINAFIPENYISNQAQRVDCYRKIARIATAEDAEDITDELIDRYGEPPASVLGLIDVARFRNMAARSNVTEIAQIGDDLVFYLGKFDMLKLSAVTKAVGKRMRLETVGRPRMLVSVKGGDTLELMKTVISAMDEAVDS